MESVSFTVPPLLLRLARRCWADERFSEGQVEGCAGGGGGRGGGVEEVAGGDGDVGGWGLCLSCCWFGCLLIERWICDYGAVPLRCHVKAFLHIGHLMTVVIILI